MSNININAITDGTTVLVKGKVDYSQITKKLEGAELESDNTRRAKYGVLFETKPHTRLTISQACVAFDDASNPTIAEQFIEDKLYLSKKYPAKNFMYNGLNKGAGLPVVYARDETDPMQLTPIFPKGELAAELEVTLLLRVYSTKANFNKGISLEAIICDEPIRYVSVAGTSDSVASLVARGFRLARDISRPAYQSAIPAT
jgi:hypothetical protein